MHTAASTAYPLHPPGNVAPTPLVLPAGELPARIGIRTVQFLRGIIAGPGRRVAGELSPRIGPRAAATGGHQGRQRRVGEPLGAQGEDLGPDVGGHRVGRDHRRVGRRRRGARGRVDEVVRLDAVSALRQRRRPEPEVAMARPSGRRSQAAGAPPTCSTTTAWSPRTATRSPPASSRRSSPGARSARWRAVRAAIQPLAMPPRSSACRRGRAPCRGPRRPRASGDRGGLRAPGRRRWGVLVEALRVPPGGQGGADEGLEDAGGPFVPAHARAQQVERLAVDGDGFAGVAVHARELAVVAEARPPRLVLGDARGDGLDDVEPQVAAVVDAPPRAGGAPVLGAAVRHARPRRRCHRRATCRCRRQRARGRRRPRRWRRRPARDGGDGGRPCGGGRTHG